MRTPDSWHSVFMDIARNIARKSKDNSTRCGSVIVSKNNKILALGFNGPPPQIDDSKVPWEERRSDRVAKYCMVIHAEENSISFAKQTHSQEEITGSTIYVTSAPCAGCVLRIIGAGIEKVIFDDLAPKAKCVDDLEQEKIVALVSSLKPEFRFQIIPYSNL